MTNEIESQPHAKSTGLKPPKLRIKIGLLCILLASVWVIVADGYWHHRQRLEHECRSGLGETLVNGAAGRLSAEVLYDDLIALSRVVCRFKIGAGHLIRDPRGLAYWEVILMTPVLLRFNWDHN